jgi:hemolysin III
VIAPGAAPVKRHASPIPHAIGTLLALCACVVLAIRFRADGAHLAVMLTYGASLVVMFGASTLYHGFGEGGPMRAAVFRRIDHAGIFVLIAGTYTPVLFFGLEGTWRAASLIAVWAVALAGIVETMWLVGLPRIVNTALYAAFGWGALIPGPRLLAALPREAIVLIVAGGLLYTVGAAIYATRSFDIAPRSFGFHGVFHVFVLAGAIVHFAAIAFALPAA